MRRRSERTSVNGCFGNTSCGGSGWSPLITCGISFTCRDPRFRFIGLSFSMTLYDHTLSKDLLVHRVCNLCRDRGPFSRSRFGVPFNPPRFLLRRIHNRCNRRNRYRRDILLFFDRFLRLHLHLDFFLEIAGHFIIDEFAHKVHDLVAERRPGNNRRRRRNHGVGRAVCWG